MSAFVVTGRSVADYAKCGAAMPADCVIEACVLCGDPVTITRDATAKMEIEKRSGAHRLVAAICTPCTFAFLDELRVARGIAAARRAHEAVDNS
jgi:hypothetical protein